MGDYKNKKFYFKNLNTNVTLNFITKKSSPTIVKSKIIDTSNNSKLLGLYEFNDKKLSINEEKSFYKIKKNINKFNIIIVSDYGHSFISQKIANYLSKHKKVIVNTQLNSANHGYHTIGKYKNCNWAIINEVELRHELRDRYIDIKKLMVKLANKLQIKT